MGCDKKALIRVIGNRTARQRLIIAKQFKVRGCCMLDVMMLCCDQFALRGISVLLVMYVAW
jgi:hypothetical protein